MPELPEVETMRRGVLGVEGAEIADVHVISTTLKPLHISPSERTFRKRAVGQKIAAVERLGKRVVFRLGSADRIIFEPRMTGLVLSADPPNETHLRFKMHLEGGSIPIVWYWDRRGLGSVRLVSEKQLGSLYGPDRLGPDALEFALEDWQDRLGSSQREIKVAMLDQRAIAGIGNLYASEILHVAGVDPRKKCRAINRSMWASIDSATQEVLRNAIKYEGSTLGDGTYRNALNKEGSYQNHHRVYMKAGETCRTCQQGVIRRIVQAQRSTFFCPACQRKSGR
jgi:formamidopyrimidine-DNA glycosylase